MNPVALIIASIAVVVASSVCTSPATGQWVVGIEVGAERYWGGSAETGVEHRSFRPYRPTTFGIGLERRAARLGAAVRLRYASASLALEGKDALVAVKGVFSVYSVAPELTYRVAPVGANQLSIQGGPLLDIWSLDNADSQILLGVQAGLLLRVPLGNSIAGSITAGAAVSPSPFTAEQLEAGFERRALWRRRVAAGLEYRL